MLQDDFYAVSNLAQAENIVTAQLSLNGNHKIFEGHFPGQPVVPGVCMLQMVTETARNATGKKLHLLKADNMKFLTVIDPRQTQSVNFELKYTVDEAGQVHALASIFNAEIVYFKFKGVLKEIL